MMTSYAYELMQDGYKLDAPTVEADQGDAEVVEGMRCRRCGGKMHFEGYHTDTSYIALAVCNECGKEVEF
jgi:hypothetical protein